MSDVKDDKNFIAARRLVCTLKKPSVGKIKSGLGITYGSALRLYADLVKAGVIARSDTGKPYVTITRQNLDNNT